jgi:hypothetical protein
MEIESAWPKIIECRFEPERFSARIGATDGRWKSDLGPRLFSAFEVRSIRHCASSTVEQGERGRIPQGVGIEKGGYARLIRSYPTIFRNAWEAAPGALCRRRGVPGASAEEQGGAVAAIVASNLGEPPVCFHRRL